MAATILDRNRSANRHATVDAAERAPIIERLESSLMTNFDHHPDEANPRVVLLGASNVARTFDAAVDVARTLLGSPLDVFAAIGRGRSYGQPTKLLVRSLGSIGDCGMWSTLERENHGAPTYAVLTDVGNDIIYGSDDRVIAEWVRGCVQRLRDSGAEVIITGLPLERLKRITPREFDVFLRLLYPKHELTLEHGLDQANRVHEALRDIANEIGATFVEQDGTWYAVDPVHIPQWRATRAWWSIMRHWPGVGRDAAKPPRRSIPRWAYTSLLPPEERWWFSRIIRRHEQPAGRLRDGTRFWLY